MAEHCGASVLGRLGSDARHAGCGSGGAGWSHGPAGCGSRAPAPVLAGLVLAATAAAQDVLVDCGAPAGTIRSLQGVNGGPIYPYSYFPYDLTGWYRGMRVDSIRTHDYQGPLDLPGMFPDQARRPDDPAAYDFTESDRIMLAIAASGAAPFLRLGTSSATADWRIQDLSRMAEVCRNVVRHYNQGWPNGSGYYLGIRWVEFWNEPDLVVNGQPKYWHRSPQDFWTMYEQVARRLKADDPTIQVGACGLASPTASSSRPYREDFLDYCATYSVPLDFYSWHHYGSGSKPDSFQLAQTAQTMRQALAQHGFPGLRQCVTEWNVSVFNNQLLASLPGAAFCASALTYLQDEADVVLAHHYRGDYVEDAQQRPLPIGLFGGSGQQPVPLPRAWAFRLHGRMQLTPDRVAVTLTGGNQFGFAVLAGASPDGSEVQVLASDPDWGTPNLGRTLELRNLPFGAGGALLERWEVRADGTLAAVETRAVRHTGTVRTSLPAGAFVQLLRVRRQEPAAMALAVDDSSVPWQDPQVTFALLGRRQYTEAPYVLASAVARPGAPLGIVTPFQPTGVAGVLDATGLARGTLSAPAAGSGSVGTQLTLLGVLVSRGAAVAASNPETVAIR